MIHRTNPSTKTIGSGALRQMQMVLAEDPPGSASGLTLQGQGSSDRVCMWQRGLPVSRIFPEEREFGGSPHMHLPLLFSSCRISTGDHTEDSRKELGREDRKMNSSDDTKLAGSLQLTSVLALCPQKTGGPKQVRSP